MSKPTVTGISSMATRQVLAELSAQYTQRSGVGVAIESVGGVDAARRVQGGETFDVVLLASDAIDKLLAGAALAAGSRVDFVRSPVAVAVQAGAPRPAIDSEAALRQAVLAARSLGYSTGPSGTHLVRLFQRWGLAEQLAARTVQAPAGLPVASLVASGQVELGFQQLSELMHFPGIDVLGLLPPDIAFITVFAAAIATTSSQPEAARGLLAWLVSPDTAAVKRRHGMEPA